VRCHNEILHDHNELCGLEVSIRMERFIIPCPFVDPQRVGIGNLESDGLLNDGQAGEDGTQIAVTGTSEFLPSAIYGTLVESETDLQLDDPQGVG